MNGELAQVVALVSHGNDYLLRNPGANPPPLQKSNSTFQYVAKVVFTRYKSPSDSKGKQVCDGVDSWLKMLRSKKARRLWNIAFAWDRTDVAEHQAAAFAGGIPRAIQADMPTGFELWYPAWRTGGPDATPWKVEYRALVFPTNHAFTQVDVTSVRQHLQSAVEKARKLAGDNRSTMETWEGFLTDAIALLSDSKPVIPYHPDMLPEAGYSLSERQLIAAACRAFVFGGMGSWNDISFATKGLQEKYEQVTRDLYEAVKMAIVVGSNQYRPDGT